MVSTASLSTKLVRIGAGLLLVALASISLTLWVTWQLEGGAAAVNEAGRMRMQTWRLTSVAQAGLAQADVAALVQEFDRSLELLRRGDASRPLFVPWDDAVGREFATVEALWPRAQALVQQRLSARPSGDRCLAGTRWPQHGGRSRRSLAAPAGGACSPASPWRHGAAPVQAPPDSPTASGPPGRHVCLRALGPRGQAAAAGA